MCLEPTRILLDGKELVVWEYWGGILQAENASKQKNEFHVTEEEKERCGQRIRSEWGRLVGNEAEIRQCLDCAKFYTV